MKVKKIESKELIDSIKRNKVIDTLMLIISILSLVVYFFVVNNFLFLVLFIISIILSIYLKQLQLFDKIRLELRFKKQ